MRYRFGPYNEKEGYRSIRISAKGNVYKRYIGIWDIPYEARLRIPNLHYR